MPPPIPPRTRKNTDHSPQPERRRADDGQGWRGHRRAASDSSVMSGVSEDQEGLQISSPAPPPLPPKRRGDAVAFDPGSTGTEGTKGEGEKREENKVEEREGKGRDVKIDSINDMVTDDLDEWTMVEPQMTESLSFSQQQSSIAPVSTPKTQAKKKKQRWTKRREYSVHVHHAN